MGWRAEPLRRIVLKKENKGKGISGRSIGNQSLRAGGMEAAGIREVNLGTYGTIRTLRQQECPARNPSCLLMFRPRHRDTACFGKRTDCLLRLRQPKEPAPTPSSDFCLSRENAGLTLYSLPRRLSRLFRSRWFQGHGGPEISLVKSRFSRRNPLVLQLSSNTQRAANPSVETSDPGGLTELLAPRMPPEPGDAVHRGERKASPADGPCNRCKGDSSRPFSLL